MESPKFSLIISHYNLPHLLRRLLHSIPERSDLQVIVVDDCSTKGHEDLEVVKKDYPAVEFYSTGTNGGGGKARNVGLDHARGEYVFFADSDDFFTPGLDKLLNRFADNTEKSDILFFNVQGVDAETFRPVRRAEHLNRYIMQYEKETEKAILNLKYLFGEPWCKLIRRSMVEEHGLRFEEIPVHNDTYFSYMIGYYAKSVSVSPIVAYIVTERLVSVSTYKFSNKEFIRTEVFAKKNRFLEDNRIPVFDKLFLTPFKMAYKSDREILPRLQELAAPYGYDRKKIIRRVLMEYIHNLKLRLKRGRLCFKSYR